MLAQMSLVCVDALEGLYLADLAVDGEGSVGADRGLGERAADHMLDEMTLQVADAVEHLAAHPARLTGDIGRVYCAIHLH